MIDIRILQLTSQTIDSHSHPFPTTWHLLSHRSLLYGPTPALRIVMTRLTLSQPAFHIILQTAGVAQLMALALTARQWLQYWNGMVEEHQKEMQRRNMMLIFMLDVSQNVHRAQIIEDRPAAQRATKIITRV